jgi:hypothetical protein
MTTAAFNVNITLKQDASNDYVVLDLALTNRYAVYTVSVEYEAPDISSRGTFENQT